MTASTPAKTKDERLQDEILKKFGFEEGSDATPAPGGSDSGEELDPNAPSEADPTLSPTGEEVVPENPFQTQDAPAEEPHPGDPKGPKGWEKRARDNQHNYHLERNAREKVEKVATELKAELDAQRSQFQRILEDITARMTGSSTPEKPAATVSAEPEEDPLGEYPEIATGVNKKFAPLEERLAKIQKTLDERETANSVASFLDQVASPEGGNVPEIRTIIADPAFNKWVDDKGGYVQRVMRQTFNKDFGFGVKDVAEVIGRYYQDTGKTQPSTPAKPNTPAKPAVPSRPAVPSGANQMPTRTAGDLDIFSAEEMNNLQVMADKAGRAFAKGLDPKALDKFEEKMNRSIEYYSKQEPAK